MPQKPRILIVTRGDYLTRLSLGPLLRSDRYELQVVIVSGDGRGRVGLPRLKALWRASQFEYFAYELSQFLFFSIADRCPGVPPLSVANVAESLSIPVARVVQINSPEARQLASAFNPDLLVCVKCPQLIGAEVLNIPAHGGINVHASLLPSHAGRAPHFWAMARGEESTGSTVHYMTQKWDMGKILMHRQLHIPRRASAFSILAESSRRIGAALPEAVELALAGTAGEPQRSAHRSYHSHPTAEAYSQFRNRGYVLGRLSEFIRAIRRETIAEKSRNAEPEPSVDD